MCKDSLCVLPLLLEIVFRKTVVFVQGGSLLRREFHVSLVEALPRKFVNEAINEVLENGCPTFFDVVFFSFGLSKLWRCEPFE
jgi:hypothetical protein